MKCPFCGFEDTKVTNSRTVESGNSIRRRRNCEKCNNRFTTYERIEKYEFFVTKRDGTIEAFEPNKLKDGLVKSCNKRPVPISEIEKIIRSVENYAVNNNMKEISSDKIGEIVMNKLKELDVVSYVRFASVYKKFEDIDTFKLEIDKLSKEK